MLILNGNECWIGNIKWSFLFNFMKVRNQKQGFLSQFLFKIFFLNLPDWIPDCR